MLPRRILDLLNIEVPVIQAPMAGAMDSELAIAVARAGGLGSLPCAMLSPDQMRSQIQEMRNATANPININFFCHTVPVPDPDRERAWKRHFAHYYRELGIDPDAPLRSASRMPFDSAACDVVEDLKPEIVSFHFGLPDEKLLARVRAAGAKVLSSATTVEEAIWLEQRGCDAVIAQGAEAGGHRGTFLTNDIATQVGTMALVPQIVDAVKIPVIAAGGIGDSRGIAAAFALGASAVQMGTAYLLCPETRISEVHRAALRAKHETVITNVFSGRPARGILNRLIREVSPISDLAPPFPLAASVIAPLRRISEGAGSQDFAQMWAGQAAALCKEVPAGELTRSLADELISV